MDLVPWEYRSVLEGYFPLNTYQRTFFAECFQTDKNIVITGPTSSGKSLGIELVILRLIDQFKSNRSFKIIYLAHLQSLCHLNACRWTSAFEKFNINIVELHDDSTKLQDLSQYNLILSTPETWNSVTRTWKDDLAVMSSIRLVVIDDLFLLNEPRRGPNLEAVVTRMKWIDNFFNYGTQMMRFLAISCTISNAADIGQWFGGSSTKVFEFPPDHRPLETHVFGYPSYSTFSNYQFDIHLTYKLEQHLRQYRCSSQPTLIFCSSRKGVEFTAQHLSKVFMGSNLIDESQTAAINAIEYRLHQLKLLQLIKTGVAYYHAGLSYEDRSVVETLFKAGHLPILVSTNSVTTNLRADLVIIKSTNTYGDVHANEYSSMDVLNMVGKAGAAEMDEPKGVAIILTSTEKIEKYQNLINGTVPIESNLKTDLVEHLNTEIVLETVTNLRDAINWLRTTFFYVRAIKMRQVAARKGVESTPDSIEQCLRELCEGALQTLRENRLIVKDGQADSDYQADDNLLTATENGRLVAKHRIAIESMRLLYQINGSETLGELLDIVCQMNEFRDFKLRPSERNTFNALNGCCSATSEGGRAYDKSIGKTSGGGGVKTLRFPLPGKITTVPMKISCLLQAMLGNVIVGDAVQETTKIHGIALRLARCLYEYVRNKAKLDGERCLQVLVGALTLLKCLEVRMWENSPSMLSQLPKIGPASMKSLAAAGISNFEQLSEASARDVEKILKRSPPFGDEMQAMLQRLPTYFVTLHKCQPSSTSPPMMGMDGTFASVGNDAHHSRCIGLQHGTDNTDGGSSIKVNVKRSSLDSESDLNGEISLIVGDAKSNRILFYKENVQTKLREKLSLDFHVATGESQATIIVAQLIHHSIVGLDQRKMLTVNIEKQRKPSGETYVKAGGGAGDGLRSKQNGSEEFDFIRPKKRAKLCVAEGFTVDSVFSASEKEEQSVEGADQEHREADRLGLHVGERQGNGPQYNGMSVSLLSMLEARDRWNGPRRRETSIDKILEGITGKSSSQALVAKPTFTDIMKRKRSEGEGKQRRVEVFENLRIFFE